MRQQPRESVVALAVIAAAALATFAALLITSRPYDPMNSTLAPQVTVPPGPVPMATSPAPSPTSTASPLETQTAEQSPEMPSQTETPTDAEIKSEIDQAFASNTTLANLDVTAIVENGRVTLSGAVNSPEIKQTVERTVRSIKGVTGVNNQLVIIQTTPPEDRGSTVTMPQEDCRGLCEPVMRHRPTAVKIPASNFLRLVALKNP